MTRSTSISNLGSEFNDFLFAPIGEDRNGMLLSVLSALARLDVDPWQKAAELARLPGEAATQRLASLIAGLPDEPSARRDPGTIAARLVELLPRRATSNIPPRKTLLGAGAAIDLQAVMCMMFCVIFMAALLGGQFIMASRQPRAPVANGHAAASSTVLPERSSQRSGDSPARETRNE